MWLQALVKKIGLSQQAAKFFGLFQRMEHDFGEALQPDHSSTLYIACELVSLLHRPQTAEQ